MKVKHCVERLLVEGAEVVSELVDVFERFLDKLELTHARQIHEYDARVDAVQARIGHAALLVIHALVVEAVGRHGHNLRRVELVEYVPQVLERRENQVVNVQVDHRLE